MDDRDEMFGYLQEAIQQITQLKQGQTQSNETITQMQQEIDEFKANTSQSGDMIARLKQECNLSDQRMTDVDNDVVKLVQSYQKHIRDLAAERDNLQPRE